MNHSSYKGQPFADLSPAQHERLDEFVRQLRQNDPNALTGSQIYDLKKENDRLQAQMDILNSKGYDIIRHQLESFFKEKGAMFGSGGNNGDSGKLASQINELKTHISQMMNSGQFMGGGSQNFVSSGGAINERNASYYEGPKPVIPQFHSNGNSYEAVVPKFGSSMVKTHDGQGHDGVSPQNASVYE